MNNIMVRIHNILRIVEPRTKNQCLMSNRNKTTNPNTPCYDHVIFTAENDLGILNKKEEHLTWQ